MGVANRPLPGKEAPRMPHVNPGPFCAQVRFLRRQFLQEGDLPFTNVLTEEVIAQALTALGGWLDLLPAGDALGLPRTGLECRPFLPRRRRPPARPPRGPGATPVLPTDRRLLPGPQAPARVVLRRCGAPHGTGLG